MRHAFSSGHTKADIMFPVDISTESVQARPARRGVKPKEPGIAEVHHDSRTRTIEPCSSNSALSSRDKMGVVGRG